jgi:hypothetical protein
VQLETCESSCHKVTHACSCLRSLLVIEGGQYAMQAQQETEEAIQAGNHRYNSMLHENMNTRDELCQKMEALKLEIAGKAGEVRDLDSKMKRLQKDSEESQCRQLKSWEEERRAAEKQKEQVRLLVLHS